MSSSANESRKKYIARRSRAHLKCNIYIYMYIDMYIYILHAKHTVAQVQDKAAACHNCVAMPLA